MGVLIALAGLFSAFSTDVLGLVDQVAGDLFLVIGALGMSILVGWFIREDTAAELAKGASPGFARFIPAVMFLVRWVLPPVIAFVLWFAAIDAWNAVVDFFAG